MTVVVEVVKETAFGICTKHGGAIKVLGAVRESKDESDMELGFEEEYKEISSAPLLHVPPGAVTQTEPLSLENLLLLIDAYQVGIRGEYDLTIGIHHDEDSLYVCNTHFSCSIL
ncbi:hypothetical protein Cadr_000022671 [Camelus dromedarius]|uniref:Uncharacterized protein n=1 Tax=Camelus dromedarius TaxID=9838 RepID=A0A5N4CGB7_CAMDR|nr:hypothetical protein Cadr_000022671 [Camelus dromedarius]